MDGRARIDEIVSLFAVRGKRLHLAQEDDGSWTASVWDGAPGIGVGYAQMPRTANMPAELDAAEAVLALYESPKN